MKSVSARLLILIQRTILRVSLFRAKHLPHLPTTKTTKQQQQQQQKQQNNNNKNSKNKKNMTYRKTEEPENLDAVFEL